MFRKMNNKKGFTLIELMAVIAIIAVLVGVILPTVTGANDKARGAANAANLRTVEAELATLKVTNPNAFVKDTDELGRILAEYSQKVADAKSDLLAEESKYSAKKAEYDSTPSWNVIKKGALFLELSEIVIKVGVAKTVLTVAEEVLDDRATFYRYGYTAVDGVITLADGTKITAPTSQALEVGGFTLEKGVEMSVVVMENSIVASYDGLTKDCFAIVAEGGKNVDLSSYNHTYRDNDGNGTCDTCNGSYNHSPADILVGSGS